MDLFSFFYIELSKSSESPPDLWPCSCLLTSLLNLKGMTFSQSPSPWQLLRFATCLTVIFLSRSNKGPFLFLISPLLIHFINKTKNFSFQIEKRTLMWQLPKVDPCPDHDAGHATPFSE